MKSTMTRLSGLPGILLLCSLAVSNISLGQAGSGGDSTYAVALNINANNPSQLDGSPVNSDLVPDSLIRLDRAQENVIWVEMAKGLLHLMIPNPDSGQWQIGFSRPISIGKAGFGKQIEGDNRTPVGLYRVTSFLPDEQLSDYYGHGAFPIDYPNTFDRLKNRTGYGIWLHGLPKGIEQRPLLDSEGCVVIDNTAFDWLKEYLKEGQTRVFLGDQISWTSPTQLEMQRRELETAIEGWRTAWISKNNEAYLSYYAENFTSLNRNLAQWVEYKTRINNAKDWIEVDISNLNILAYPGETDLIVIEYDQTYRSSNYNDAGKKQLFWRRQVDGSWKIIFEGAA